MNHEKTGKNEKAKIPTDTNMTPSEQLQYLQAETKKAVNSYLYELKENGRL